MDPGDKHRDDPGMHAVREKSLRVDFHRPGLKALSGSVWIQSCDPRT
jgi:hypothetical protein